MAAAPLVTVIYRGFLLSPPSGTNTANIYSVAYNVRYSSDDSDYSAWQPVGTAYSFTNFQIINDALLTNVFYQYQCKITYQDRSIADWGDYAIPGNGQTPLPSVSSLDQLASSLGTITSGYLRGVVFETSANYPKVRFDPTGFYSISTTSTPLLIDATTGNATFTGTVTGSTIIGNTFATSSSNPRVVIDPTGIYAVSTTATPFSFSSVSGIAQINGQIVAASGSNIPANTISGSIVSTQIGSVAASTITGSITSSQIGSVAASTITGSITSGQIGSVNATTITGSIVSTQIGSVAASTITGSITSSQIGSVAASTITGLVNANQINSITAGQITGSITAGQITSITAGQITGSITSGQISSVAASTITGSITSAQIGSVNASAITGSITSAQIGSVAASAITGSITSGQIGSINANVISSGTVPPANMPIIGGGNLLPDASFEGTLWYPYWSNSGVTATPVFAPTRYGIRAIAVSYATPSTDPFYSFNLNDTATLNAVKGNSLTVSGWVYIPSGMTNSVIPRGIGVWDGTTFAVTGSLTSVPANTWTRLTATINQVVAAPTFINVRLYSPFQTLATPIFWDGIQLEVGSVPTSYAPKTDEILPGTVTGAQIASNAAISAGQISTVNASAIQGSITAGQIGSVNASAITGSITSAQIGSVSASTITGSITAGQITSLTAGQITGTLTSSQIASVAASTITGLITSSQINSLTAGQITGTLVSSQIASVAASTITGSITSSQIGSVNASAITGSITSSQIGSVAASTITGSITSSQIGSVAATSITGSITSGQIGSINANVITSGVVPSASIPSLGGDNQILNSSFEDPINALSGWSLSQGGAGGSLTSISPSTPLYGSNVAVLTYGNNWTYNNQSITLQGTRPVTASAWVYLNVPTYATPSVYIIVRPNQGNGYLQAVSAVPVTPRTWTRVYGTVTPTVPQAVNGTLSIGWEQNATQGDVMWQDGIQFEFGSVPTAYAPKPDEILSRTVTGTQIATNAAIQAGQISSITAGQITGSIVAGQIGSVNASAITGSITAGQITSLTAGQITGTLTSSQIASVAASTITGTLTSTQIGSVAANTITGTITSSQIASVAAGTITGTINSSQINTVTAGQITGTVTASQISVSSLSALSANMGSITSGTITGATFQTSASNPRVIMDSTGVYSLDSGGNVTFKADASTGKIITLTGIGGGNKVVNSRADAGIGSWRQYNSTNTATPLYSRSGANSFVVTSTSNSGASYLYVEANDPNAIKVVPGQQITISGYAYTTLAGVVSSLESRCWNGTTTIFQSSNNANLTQNAWTRVVATYTMPAGAINTGYSYTFTSTATGQVVYWTDLQVEEGSLVTSYAPKPDEILPGTVSGTQIASNAGIVGTQLSSTAGIVSSQITSVLASAISGSITAGQIASIAATQITGSITSAQIGSVAASTITGTITSSQIASVSAATITGSIVAGQIGSVNASAITGSITAGQITSITAGQITGTLTSSQINTITAGQITGSIVSTQIGSVNAATITVGTLGASQISSIYAGNVVVGGGGSGTMAGSLISAGTITATQIKVGLQSGLLASYWLGDHSLGLGLDAFQGPAIANEIVGPINWTSKAPGGNANYWSTRISGFLQFPVVTGYTLTLTSDDGVRVWFNNQPVITTGWLSQAMTPYSFTATPANTTQYYPIVIEHDQGSGGEGLHFQWTPNTTSTPVDVPLSAMWSGGSVSAASIQAQSIGAEEVRVGSITADRMNVTTLSAITANMGTITAGTLSSGTIFAGALSAATGSFAGSLSAATGSFTGSLSGANITGATGTFTGSITGASGTFAGSITGASGTIGGITFNSSGITSSHWSVDTSGNITATNVNISGAITATSGTFAGSLSAAGGTLGTITAGTITGATVQSASSGSRVVLDSTGLNAFNTGGVNVMNFSTSTGVLTLSVGGANLVPNSSFANNTNFYTQTNSNVPFVSTVDWGVQNFIGNPNFSADTLGAQPAGWSVTTPSYYLTSGSSATTVTVTAPPPNAAYTKAMQVVTTAVSGQGVANNIGRLGLGTYTASIYVKTTDVGPDAFTLFAGPANASGQTTAISVTTSWQRFSVTFTQTDISQICYVGVRSASATAMTIQVGAVMCNPGSSASVYADGNTSGWAWSGGANTSSSYRVVSFPGSTAFNGGVMQLLSTGVGNMSVNTNPIPVKANTQYTAQAWVRAAIATASTFVQIQYLDVTGTQISMVSGTAATDTAGVWTIVSYPAFTTPAGTASVVIYVVFTTPASGDVHYIGAMQLQEGTVGSAYTSVGSQNVATLSGLSANLGSITGGTITGATFQTASSAPMVVVNPNGLYSLTTTATPVAITSDGRFFLGLNPTTRATPLYMDQKGALTITGQVNLIDGQNIIGSPPQFYNSGFETNATGWSSSTGTITRDTTQAHSGVASGTIDKSTTFTGNLIAGSQFIAGINYTFTFWTRAYATPVPTGTVQVVTLGPNENVPAVAWTSVLNTWTQQSVTWQPKYTHPSATVSLSITTNSASFNFDDFAIAQSYVTRTPGSITWLDNATKSTPVSSIYNWEGNITPTATPTTLTVVNQSASANILSSTGGSDFAFANLSNVILDDLQPGIVNSADLSLQQGIIVDSGTGAITINFNSGTAYLTTAAGALSRTYLPNTAGMILTPSTLPTTSNYIGYGIEVDALNNYYVVNAVTNETTLAAALTDINNIAPTANRLRLYDIGIQNSAGVYILRGTRDRRPWARGFYNALTAISGTDYSTTAGIWQVVDASFLQVRVECSGAPIRVMTSGNFAVGSGTNPAMVGILLDGAIVASPNSVARTTATTYTPFSLVQPLTPSAGSHLIALGYGTQGTPGTALIERNSATAPGQPVLIVEELVRQNANNGNS